jgi:hypothetical protein
MCASFIHFMGALLKYCVHLIWLLLFCNILTASSASSKGFNVPTLVPHELIALRAFYNSTNGPYWNYVSIQFGIPWFTPNTDPCQNFWKGIECGCNTTYDKRVFEDNNYYYSKFLSDDFIEHNTTTKHNTTCNIVKLVLKNTTLFGTIPPQFAALHSLQYLRLPNNHLYGPVNSIIGNMVDLRVLDLSYNLFTGSLSTGLGSMKNLSYINLQNNMIVSTIPNNIGALTNLVVVNFQQNHFRYLFLFFFSS